MRNVATILKIISNENRSFSIYALAFPHAEFDFFRKSMTSARFRHNDSKVRENDAKHHFGHFCLISSILTAK